MFPFVFKKERLSIMGGWNGLQESERREDADGEGKGKGGGSGLVMLAAAAVLYSSPNLSLLQTVKNPAAKKGVGARITRTLSPIAR